MAKYPNNDACLDEIMRLRFGASITCPECKNKSKFHRATKKRRCYECQWCGYQIHPTKNTIFEHSSTPLSYWFYAIYLMTATRSGVSAKELERQLGVTYKCAWRMAMKIRELVGKNDATPLKGTVEADETYIGRRTPGAGGRGAKGKTKVFGMLERKGDVKTVIMENLKKKTIMPIIEKSIEKGSRIDMDEFLSYNGLSKAGYDHQTVNHKHGQYVNGDIYTNSLEGFWSQLKRSISGTHIHVSKKHLQNYANEFAFRYNNRQNPAMMFSNPLSNL